MNHIDRKNCDIFSSPLENNHDRYTTLVAKLGIAFNSDNTKVVTEVLKEIINFPQTSAPIENKVTLSAKCFECGRIKPVWATIRTDQECSHYCAYCWSE